MTRQRAEELLKEASAIWARSNQAERLEGIDKDPAFALLLTALAYQANEIDNEIEQLKDDVLNDFARMLIPYERLNALPATAVVEVEPEAGVAAVDLDHRASFTLVDTPFAFVPLLRTRALNVEVASVVRIDNRRWRVGLVCKEPLASLAGLCLVVDSQRFQDLKIFANGYALPLVKPWDYADLPLAPCFSLRNMLYNRASVYQGAQTWLDLFAKHDVRMFFVGAYKTTARPVEKMDLTFEFIGIDDDFLFDKTRLRLNTTVLVNAFTRSVTLSADMPLAKLAGGDDEAGRAQFVHLLPPADLQRFRDEPIELRRVATDRFTPDALIRLAMTLLTRFSTDYYAFQGIESLRDGNFMDRFYQLLRRMAEGVEKAAKTSPSGIYLLLKNTEGLRPRGDSLQVGYVMTNGAAVNHVLTDKSAFAPEKGSYLRAVRQVASPLPGADEIRGADAELSLSRYYMITNDRLVTPADVKVFCYNELMTRYGISSDLIHEIRVRDTRDEAREGVGFQTRIYISLKSDPFVKRSFQEKIPAAELALRKMIETRSTNVFPVQVSIEINEIN